MAECFSVYLFHPTSKSESQSKLTPSIYGGALRCPSKMLRKSHCQGAEPSAWNGRVGLPVVGGAGQSETDLVPKEICHCATCIVQQSFVCLKETNVQFLLRHSKCVCFIFAFSVTAGDLYLIATVLLILSYPEVVY